MIEERRKKRRGEDNREFPFISDLNTAGRETGSHTDRETEK